MPRASSLAAAIKEEFDVEPEMIAGGGGIYDVKLNGKLVFSKHELGRFPENDEEVLDLLHKEM